MFKIDMTGDEIDLLVSAIGVRLCYLETGTPVFRAQDVHMGEKIKIRSLSEEQKILVGKIEDLKTKLENEMYGSIRCGK